jgi:hypothetical protein
LGAAWALIISTSYQTCAEAVCAMRTLAQSIPVPSPYREPLSPCNARPQASQTVPLNLPHRSLGKCADKPELAGQLEMCQNAAR